MKSESPCVPQNVVVFRVDDGMSAEEIDQLSKRLQRASTPGLPTRVLLEVTGFRHMEPALLASNLRFLDAASTSVERVALLGNRVWIKSWIKAGGFPYPTTVEYFDRSESQEAWRWLTA